MAPLCDVSSSSFTMTAVNPLTPLRGRQMVVDDGETPPPVCFWTQARLDSPAFGELFNDEFIDFHRFSTFFTDFHEISHRFCWFSYGFLMLFASGEL